MLKSALRRIVGQDELNFGELHTVLIQVKNMISHLIYGRNINRRNIVNDNGDIVTLDKTLIKTCIIVLNTLLSLQTIFGIDFMKNICYHFLKNIVIMNTIQTKNEN